MTECLATAVGFSPWWCPFFVGVGLTLILGGLFSLVVRLLRR